MPIMQKYLKEKECWNITRVVNVEQSPHQKKKKKGTKNKTGFQLWIGDISVRSEAYTFHRQ